MGLFRRRGDVLDLTMLQKRGLLPASRPISRDPRIGLDGTLDLTMPSSSNLPSSLTASESSVGQSSGSPFSSFFGGGAIPETSSSMEPPREIGIEPPREMTMLRERIDNVEFKIDRLLSRLDIIDSKLLNFESKF